MAYEKIKGLEQFIEDIVIEAYYLANEGRTLEGFESKLTERISKKYGVPNSSVSSVYRPFHWSFFDGKVTDSQNSDLSPIKMVSYARYQKLLRAVKCLV